MMPYLKLKNTRISSPYKFFYRGLSIVLMRRFIDLLMNLLTIQYDGKETLVCYRVSFIFENTQNSSNKTTLQPPVFPNLLYW